MTSVGEEVVARAHIAILPRSRDTETRRVAGRWRVVQLTAKSVPSLAGETPHIEMKIQLMSIEFINMVDHLERQA